MSINIESWLGNRVHLQEIEGTELTIVQWCRPWNGSLRGARVLDPGQLHETNAALEQVTAGHREHLLRDDLAGRPLDLERLLVEVLDDLGEVDG